MARTVKCLSDGGIDLTGGKGSIIEGPTATEQMVRRRLRTGRGEIPTNLAEGVPYYESIFQSNEGAAVLEAVFRDEIAKTSTIRYVERVDIFIDDAPATPDEGRRLYVDFDAVDITGRVINRTEPIEV